MAKRMLKFIKNLKKGLKHMKKLRLMLAIIACKGAILLGKILGKAGSSAPGSLALKICPDILNILSKQVRKDIIAVCGTNGKTTTNNLLESFLTSCGYKVICNNYGANMLPGVCCAFASSASIFGKLDADFACLEIDEASTVRVFERMHPSKMIITNLFRDQLDRYGEIEITAGYIKKALSMSPETELILNGDDPLCAQFGYNTERKCTYICVDEDTGASVCENDEGRFCVFCGEKLEYEYHHYSQLGKFHCPSCGFKRQDGEFKITDITMDDTLSFTLTYGEKKYPFNVGYRGFYNIYNIAISYAVSLMCSEKEADYNAVLTKYKPQTGRMEEFTLKNKPLILNLAKNPAGFNQAIATVLCDTREKDIILAVNDNPSDGIDISWIWDVDFEKLSEGNVKSFTLSGKRCDELFVRLKYAGFDENTIKVCPSYKEAINKGISGNGEICFALANYTAVFKMKESVNELLKEASK